MRRLATALVLTALLPGTAALAQGAVELPADLAEIERVDLPLVDLFKARLADERRVMSDQVAHYAAPVDVDVDPLRDQDHNWQLVTETEARWRLRLHSPGALSLNLAFDRFRLPTGVRLDVYSVDGGERLTFTEADNESHGQLWTPPLLTDDLVLELTVAAAETDEVIDRVTQVELHLDRVQHGYAGFGEAVPRSGDCQRDVACTDSDHWLDAARSVGLISVGGVRFCTGFLVNNTNLDGRPLFITAQHCGITRKNAASLVVMWGYQSPSCRDEDGAAPWTPSKSFQTGANLRAVHGASDVALVELDDTPPGGAFFAGWDRSDAEPAGVTVIHHPNTDLKRISVDADQASATRYLASEPDAQGDHLMITAWELGTTEGGSSGAPLFNQDQRVVGQLHGGYAACGNREADWFGRLAASWNGSGKRGGRLSDWLDPLETGTLFLDGLEAADLLP